MPSTRKETSREIRELVVKLYKKNKSLREIGVIVGRAHSTVQSIINRFNTTENIQNKPRTGRPKKLTRRDERSVLMIIHNQPRTSAPNIAAQVQKITGQYVNPECIRRILRKRGYNGRVPRLKPLLSAANQEKRVRFAEEHRNKDLEFWRSCIFTDECKFTIFTSDGRGKVWRKACKAFDIKHTVPTVKHGGGAVMVWGSMAAAGVGSLVFIEGNMDKMSYLNILKGHLKNDVEKLHLGERWIFQQDQDPKHTSYIVREWLLYNVPKQLHSPPQSPDLNPIEHVWDYLKRKLQTRAVTNRESLKRVLMEEWDRIPPNVTEKLVSSMPRRLAAVLDAYGGPTKY